MLLLSLATLCSDGPRTGLPEGLRSSTTGLVL